MSHMNKALFFGHHSLDSGHLRDQLLATVALSHWHVAFCNGFMLK